MRDLAQRNEARDGPVEREGLRPRIGRPLDGSHLPAEVDALVEITNPSPEPDAVNAALDRVRDWSAVMRSAERHNVVHLVAAALGDAACRGRLPTSTRARVKSLNRMACVWDARHVRALAEIVEGFDRADVPFLVLKGLGLAERLYERPFERLSTDIDILVPAALLPRAREKLLELGYTGHREQFYEEHHFHLPFLRSPGSLAIAVELHWDVTPPSSPVRFDVESWFESPRTLQLRSGSVLLPPAIEELHYLGYHAFVEGTLVLRDLGDVRRLLDRTPGGLGAAPRLEPLRDDATAAFVEECSALAARIWGPGHGDPSERSSTQSARRWLARHLFEARSCLLDGPGRWWAFRALTRWALLNASQASLHELCRDTWTLDGESRRRGRFRQGAALGLAALLCCLPRSLFPSGFRRG